MSVCRLYFKNLSRGRSGTAGLLGYGKTYRRGRTPIRQNGGYVKDCRITLRRLVDGEARDVGFVELR